MLFHSYSVNDVFAFKTIKESRINSLFVDTHRIKGIGWTLQIPHRVHG